MEQFDRVVAVNLRGVMLCYQHAARQMIKQKRGGRLIGSIFPKIVPFTSLTSMIQRLPLVSAKEVFLS